MFPVTIAGEINIQTVRMMRVCLAHDRPGLVPTSVGSWVDLALSHGILSTGLSVL